jgi:hypothetical protein
MLCGIIKACSLKRNRLIAIRRCIYLFLRQPGDPSDERIRSFVPHGYPWFTLSETKTLQENIGNSK